jgi:hypothetical protein
MGICGNVGYHSVPLSVFYPKKTAEEVDWRGSKQEFIGLALVYTDMNMWVLHDVEFYQPVA